MYELNLSDVFGHLTFRMKETKEQIKNQNEFTMLLSLTKGFFPQSN